MKKLILTSLLLFNAFIAIAQPIDWVIEPIDQIVQCNNENSAESTYQIISNYVNSIDIYDTGSEQCSQDTFFNDFSFNPTHTFLCGDNFEVTFEAICSGFNLEKTINISIVDTIPPVWISGSELFLPTDIDVYIDDCNGGYFFPNNYFENVHTGESWDYPPIFNEQFIDECNQTEFYTIGIPPSENFPIGNHLIEYIIEDECGNITPHSFNVNILCNDCSSGPEICTESCNTFPNCHFCDMTELLNGYVSCTPEEVGTIVWPGELCNGEGDATNLSWFSFVASSQNICFTISALSCRTGHQSLMAGIFDFCEDDDGFCIAGNSSCDNDGTVSFEVSDLILGQDYYLFVGGCDGSECTFQIDLCENFDLIISEVIDDEELEIENINCQDEWLKLNYFIDENKNQIKDDNEDIVNITEHFVSLDKPFEYSAIFNQKQECYVLKAGTYGLTFLNERFIPSNLPDSITIEENDGTLELDIALCVNPDVGINDIDIHIVALQLERCNRIIPFRIKLTNTGTTPIRDTFTLNFDSLITSRFIDFLPFKDTSGELKWLIDLEQPLQSQSILVNLKMPPASFTGDLFCLYPKFNSSDNIFTDHCFELRCPFDPNDKTGQPQRGDINPILNDEELLYTIRFENLGNDTAFNIRIEDTLQSAYDLSSFRMIQSSHIISRYNIDSDRSLKVFFDDIQLPSIMQDTILNKGFFQYVVKLNEDLPIGSTVENTAFIYFDDNEFVQTNTSIHTITDVLAPKFVDSDNDGYFADVDCDDSNEFVNPGAEEICDKLDNDCNGLVDDGIEGHEAPTIVCSDVGYDFIEIAWNDNSLARNYSIYFDGFNIGHTFENNFILANVEPATVYELCVEIVFDDECKPFRNCISCQTEPFIDLDDDGYHFEEDCDDNNPNVYPGAEEICDGVDNNCDNNIDEGLSFETYYEDRDGDGFGNDFESVVDCKDVEGYVTNNLDCDDSNPEINPSALELCDGIDNNCDNNIDEGLSFETYYEDRDGDGFGNELESVIDCKDVEGYVTNNFDCDDTNPEINPLAPELCDGLDNNCDENTDEGLSFETYYEDRDGDGFGNDFESVVDCDEVDGYVTNNLDCDDTNPDINPEGEEIPNNGIDEDCDGVDFTTSTLESVLTNLNFYPNPTNHFVYISDSQNMKLDFKLISIEGLKIQDLNIGKNNIAVLPKGIYFIKVLSVEGTFLGVKKILKL
ncbi:MAG: T9SS type A sorting domain-containing protein [Bacteroidia bacterium]|nr:T9SS type A sorting domain-containing protein [Bacteroidia bacterium]